MPVDKFTKELEFIEKMNNDYIFRNNKDALERALNKESFFIKDEEKSVFAKLLIKDGLIDIKNFLINCDAMSENKVVDSVIDKFYPLKIDLHYEDDFGHQNFGLFDVSDNDCQFAVYPHEGLVNFTVEINILLPLKCSIVSIDINKINFKLLSEIGVITNFNHSVTLFKI